jgi:quinol monooxygenase YgiN
MSSADSLPSTVHCTYRVKSGNESEFLKLLERHWPTLQRLGCVTDEPARIYRGADERGRPFFVEIFHWKSDDAFARGRQHPEVLAIWEPMDGLCEPRDGRPNMEFPHVEAVTFG